MNLAGKNDLVSACLGHKRFDLVAHGIWLANR